jgi:hypothetical protein
MDPGTREEVVAFLRGWLPETARQAYRQMIETDPEGWHRHPHFAEGVIVRHALRGNGFTEEVLRVPSLELLWPDLLARAVLLPEDEPPAGSPADRSEDPDD